MSQGSTNLASKHMRVNLPQMNGAKIASDYDARANLYANDKDDDDFEEKYIVSGPTPPIKFQKGGATTTNASMRDGKNSLSASYENVLSKMKPHSHVSSQVALSNNNSPICQAKKKAQVASLKASADQPPVVKTTVDNSFVIRTVGGNH